MAARSSAAALLGVLLLAGCGGGDKPSASAPRCELTAAAATRVARFLETSAKPEAAKSALIVLDGKTVTTDEGTQRSTHVGVLINTGKTRLGLRLQTKGAAPVELTAEPGCGDVDATPVGGRLKATFLEDGKMFGSTRPEL